MNQWFDDINKLYLEGKKFMGAKYHPRFSSTATELRDLGSSVPSRDAMILISNLLEEIGVFDEDETNSVVKNFNARERGLRFVELLELHADEIINAASEIDELYPIRIERFFKVEAANRGREGRQAKYSDNATERLEKKKQQDALRELKAVASAEGEGALDVFIGALDPAEEESVELYGQSLEDKTISFEIALLDAIYVGRVKNYIKEVIGDVEVSVERNKERGKIMPRYPEIKALIEFDVEPNTPLHDAILTHGEDKVSSMFEDTLYNMDVESLVIITTPDDDPESKFKEFKSSLFPGKSSSIKVGRDFTDDVDDEEPEWGSPIPDDQGTAYSDLDDEDRYPSSLRVSSDFDDDEVDEYDSERPSWERDEDEEHDGELSEYEKKRRDAINRSKKKAGKEEENNENIKMSPQQANIWMNQERSRRMQNNLRQNERWGNYN